MNERVNRVSSKDLDQWGISNIELKYRSRTNPGTDTPRTYVRSAKSTELAKNMWHIMDGNGNLLLDKHDKYGPLNIADAPGGPMNGLRVRMWDKMARLNHLLDHPEVDPGNESLQDTLSDLSNYCVIATLVLNGQWPTKETK